MADVEEVLLQERKEKQRVVATKGVFMEEMKKTSYLALPIVMVNVSLSLLRVVSMMMVGHLGELALSGTAVATSLTNVLGFSVISGMSSALETLCGQAYGAEQYHKLGVYTYGAIISLLAVCIPISVLWIFLDKVLVFIGQDPMVSHEAGKYAICLILALFPYAILQSLNRYLQSQSLIMPMVLSSIAALLFHVPVCWVFVYRCDLGIAGAALAIGLSYWVNVILLSLYVKYSSACEKTRLGFSGDIFRCIKEFFRFAIPSTVMVCLEWWSFELVVLLSGTLPNPQLESSVLSICLLIASLHFFVPFSFGAAASTRVSNELGAGNPEGAQVAVRVAVVLAVAEVIIVATVLFCCRGVLGYAFSNEKEVVNYLKSITPFNCLLLLTDCFQAVFSGVARGCGWQHLAAYANLGAYYLLGLPVAAVLGFAFHLGGTGLWVGLNAGSAAQAALLSLITIFTNWPKQASIARERILDGKYIAEI